MGGKGINAKILFDEVAGNTGPFDPENPLLFGAGALVGTPFPGAARIDIMSKSPVTGGLGDTGMGGYLGAELKFAGYDNLVIEGKADKPVYLDITNDKVTIRDATEIWGHDTYETPGLVQKDLGNPKAQVVCIGPAGENQVVYAAIMSGIGNAAARTGLGAVMGAKNLKAVAVHGTGGIKIARPLDFLEGCKSLFGRIKQAKYYNTLHQFGLTKIHDREMRSSYALIGKDWEGCEDISESDFIDEHLHSRVGCFACPVACFDGYKINGVGSGTAKCSPYGDLSWDLRNPDLMVFWKVFVDCQRYGLDARSLSNAVGWLMALHEKNIISASDTDGIAMEWGKPEAILPMAKKMTYREGIWDQLADGLPAVAQKFGTEAEDLLLIAKGSPSDLHVPSIKTLGLASAVSPIGEDVQVQPFLGYVAAGKYVQAENIESFKASIQRFEDRAEKATGIKNAIDPRFTRGKAALVRMDEERSDMIDITGVCSWLTSFTGLPVDGKVMAEFLSLGLGTSIDEESLQEAATGLHHLERAVQGKFGFTRDDDVVSKAYYNRLKPKGKPMPELGFTEEELETMKDDYYTLMGWDLETGMPSREILLKYGIIEK